MCEVQTDDRWKGRGEAGEEGSPPVGAPYALAAEGTGKPRGVLRDTVRSEPEDDRSSTSEQDECEGAQAGTAGPVRASDAEKRAVSGQRG